MGECRTCLCPWLLYVAYDDRGGNTPTDACHPTTGLGITTLPSNDRSPEEIEELLHQIELQRRELEAQNRHLQQYRDRYVDLYDSAPVGYATLDEDGYIHEINLTGARLIGADRDSLTGHPFTDSVAKEDQNAFLDHVRQCAHEHREVTSEVMLVAQGGQTFTVQLHSIPAKSVEGEDVTYCWTAIIDITERKRAEEAQARLAAIVESSDDASCPPPVAHSPFAPGCSGHCALWTPHVVVCNGDRTRGDDAIVSKNLLSPGVIVEHQEAPTTAFSRHPRSGRFAINPGLNKWHHPKLERRSAAHLRLLGRGGHRPANQPIGAARANRGGRADHRVPTAR
jgi:PAS domain S-box-containing protein